MIAFVMMVLLFVVVGLLDSADSDPAGPRRRVGRRFGGMGGQSAFGTKAGDVFTRITIGTATIWISSAPRRSKFSARAKSLQQRLGTAASEQRGDGPAGSAAGKRRRADDATRQADAGRCQSPKRRTPAGEPTGRRAVPRRRQLRPARRKPRRRVPAGDPETRGGQRRRTRRRRRGDGESSARPSDRGLGAIVLAGRRSRGVWKFQRGGSVRRATEHDRLWRGVAPERFGWPSAWKCARSTAATSS